jgi:uncharacterized membrane protein HdeD (DUF308 family)
MNTITSTHVSRHHWWTLAIRGLIAVLFGIIAILWPGRTLLVLVILFGVFVLLDGIMAAIVSIQERKSSRWWWVLLLEGLAGIIIGVLTFISPAVTALVLLYLIAVWALVTGFLEIAEAFSGRLSIVQEWTLALAGLISILLGILLAVQPVAGLLSLVWLIGVYAIIFGILLIVRAFQFRSAPFKGASTT